MLKTPLEGINYVTSFPVLLVGLAHSLGRQLHSIEIYVHLRNKIFLSQPTLSDCWFGSHSELKNIFKIPLIPMETFWGTKILPSSEKEEFWNQFLLHVRYSLILMDIHPQLYIVLFTCIYQLSMNFYGSQPASGKYSPPQILPQQCHMFSTLILFW